MSSHPSGRARLRRLGVVAAVLGITAALVAVASPGIWAEDPVNWRPVGITAGRIAPTDAASPTMQLGASPSATASPSPRPTSPRPTARPATSPPDARVLALLARTPRFGAPPAPHRVTLTAEPGMVPWIHNVQTTQPVVFITVDDGYVKDPAVLAVLQAANVRLTAFLTVYAVNDNVAHYRSLQRLGSRIESHAITHKQLQGASYEFQRQQICDSADWLARQFGRRPTLLRPPYGLKDDTTLKIAHDCGYKAGVHWTHPADAPAFTGPDDYTVLKPGDILLLHFRADLAESLVNVLNSIKKAGLTPALLEDYIG